MNENQRRLYKLVFKIALTYRLSLENICILLGQEPTEENKQEKRQIFDLLFGEYYNLRKCYTILFDYETCGEPKNISNVSLNLAMIFFNKYMNACREGNIETMKMLIQELDELDNKIKQLKSRNSNTPVTDEDYITIAKYRVKYSISQHRISNELNIRRDTLRAHEAKIESNRLKYKIDKLTEYYLDISSKKSKAL